MGTRPLGALLDPVSVRVFAHKPSTLLQLDYEQAMELALKHLNLRRLRVKTYESALRRRFFGSTGKQAPTESSSVFVIAIPFR